jgi:hypothetical protein
MEAYIAKWEFVCLFVSLSVCEFMLHRAAYFFGDLNSMQNFNTLAQPPSGRKVCGGERKKKNNLKNTGHFVSLQHLRAGHTLCSDPKSYFFVT